MPRKACLNVSCQVKLCDFSSLRKHINERRCKILFPVIPALPTPPSVRTNGDTNTLRPEQQDAPLASSQTPNTELGNNSIPQNNPISQTELENQPLPAQEVTPSEQHQGSEPCDKEEHLPYYCRSRVPVPCWLSSLKMRHFTWRIVDG